MAPPPPQPGQPPDDRALHPGVPPPIAIVLLVLDPSMDVPAITLTLRAQGLRPIVLSTVQDAVEAVASWQPQAVLVHAGRPGWPALLQLLAERDIPGVLIGTSQQLRGTRQQQAGCVQLLAPTTPEELAEAARLVVGHTPAGTPADRIDLGVLRLDLPTRTVEVQGRQTVLPAKEFEILVQLALQPGIPLDSVELLGRVWPGSPSTTVTYLHTRVWRLRRLIGDHQRPHPLIVNRRGHGYLLNLAGPPPR